ncbi:MAG: hypothetical protein ACW976_01405 [Candidatus Ranarchaeia archaeon]|jgi:hypothetical protein
MLSNPYIQRKLTSENLRNACAFYYPQDPRKPEKEVLTAMKIGIAVSFLGCAALLLGQFLPALALWALSPILSLARYTQLSRKHHAEMQRIERYVNLIHGEIRLVNNTTGSIVDAIELISLGNYSHISDDLSNASCAINKGEVPEEIVHNLSFKPYPKPIQELFSKLAKLGHQEIQLPETAIPFHYTSFSEQLQVRLTISIALSTFIPLIINCILLVQGWGTSPILWGFYALLSAVVYYFDKILLASNISLFGEE